MNATTQQRLNLLHAIARREWYGQHAMLRAYAVELRALDAEGAPA